MSHFKKIPEVNFDAEVVHGDYHPIKDWEMDPKGYVLIRIDKEKKIIELGFCKTMNIIEIVFRGKKPQDVYFEVCKRDLLSRPDHYAYIG
ncbi:MAG: hypothetical protein NDI94_05285, partial [Candidatus Woesearchaeota archaeon]|nr:hypothetical protein [Candidatus Woesearchaeota archaeon]